jgi:hypothetical protein
VLTAPLSNQFTTHAVKAVAQEAINFLAATDFPTANIPPVDLNRPARNRDHAQQACNQLAVTMGYAVNMSNLQNNLHMFLAHLRLRTIPDLATDPTPS